MPFLTDEEIDKRLESPENLPSLLIIHERKKYERGTELPQETKEAIVRLSHSGELKQREIADLFGITQPTVSQLHNGLINSKQYDERLLQVAAESKSENSSKRSKVTDSALDALLEAVDTLKPQLCEIRKPKALSTIAKDLSVVAKNLSGNGDSNLTLNDNKQIVLHMYRPRMKEVKEYETVVG